MAEYIERAAALDVVKRTSGEYVAAWSEIAHMPAADVAEVRHGRWDAASDGDGVVCSECGTDFCTMIHETEKFRFCPNCGARMGKEAENA